MLDLIEWGSTPAKDTPTDDQYAELERVALAANAETSARTPWWDAKNLRNLMEPYDAEFTAAAGPGRVLALIGQAREAERLRKVVAEAQKVALHYDGLSYANGMPSVLAALGWTPEEV